MSQKEYDMKKFQIERVIQKKQKNIYVNFVAM